ncbi:aspartate 1-decarboxylase [Paenibacillus doosanensis]|uniref:Aspartate 1-decarboxylase n=1 Tax=Paenibacillus konkukensis TaxID=2020716 RepID=A0ABY4RJC2_9BACL|nr:MULTISPECIES: aspartate 1-decarboxylase [Paenibacillus]MCS7461688.1 aspartate 1-decarboxylase [Paenibacillus doosanensis]UQZ82115.1 Aspartate 1-decarboxylase precursor [Paenibacillus konkukensis]
MLRMMCKGKIHRATVTEARLDYVGSITIDAKLMKEANIHPYEMVQITSLRNATRWKTYAIAAPEGSGKICLNGPPAHLFQPGDIVIILSLGLFDEREISGLQPRVVFVDGANGITRVETHDLVIAEQDEPEK